MSEPVYKRGQALWLVERAYGYGRRGDEWTVREVKVTRIAGGEVFLGNGLRFEPDDEFGVYDREGYRGQVLASEAEAKDWLVARRVWEVMLLKLRDIGNSIRIPPANSADLREAARLLKIELPE